ncbi:hypothetical protein MSGX11T_00030 [Mycoplasma synoviae GX11-T]|nr:HAD-IIB family hydrolase [Mycoplasmopsis synoviae]MBD5788403.1 hypothetical protein [Mycoplasmopsis synoviae GX11-T]
MFKPSAIFIDLDHTSLDSRVNNKSVFSEKNRKAIIEINKEIPVVISTGRGLTSATKEIIDSVNLNSYVLWNGAKVVVDNEEVFLKEIPQEIALEIFDEIAKFKSVMVLNSDFKNQSYFAWKSLRFVLKLLRFDSLKKYDEFDRESTIFKFIVFDLRKEKLFKIRKHLEEKFGNFVTITESGNKNNILEISAKGVSKASGNKIFCEHKNIDVTRAIHLGDAMNDASCVGVLGKTIAFANASDAFKKVADEVLPYTYENAGLARFLEQFKK